MDSNNTSLLRSSSPKSRRSPVSPKSLRSPRSPNSHNVKQRSGQGSPLKNQIHSISSRDGRPKKGGYGAKGAWGGLMEGMDGHELDPNDPNYTSNEEEKAFTPRTSEKFKEFKKKAIEIVEEYFTNDDLVSTTNELKEVNMTKYHFYFVKKLVSMAMDRHDKEKEMASILLSSLYGDIIDAHQVYKGFYKLLEYADDLIVDIPDTVDILALFIARAVVDDILPPSFLTKTLTNLASDSKGIDVIKRAEKGYLSAPLHAETIERRWGGGKNKTVEDFKFKINDLLVEYVVSGDLREAFRCIRDLNVPHFHHEIVKRAIVKAMENKQAENCILNLLKKSSEVGMINSSQISKGFGRIIDSVDDLSFDIPNAKLLLQSLISKAASEGWLCASSLKLISMSPRSIEDITVRAFKKKSDSIILEYFLSGDVSEVLRCLEFENSCTLPELNAIFVKKLITLAMDRKNREKEMASVLLSSLCFPSEDVLNGFTLLIESAEDTALDIPIVVEDLSMFLARAEVDEVLTPQELEEIGSQFSGSDSVGNKVVQMAMALLKARLSGERILRCWGGGVSCIEDVKVKIGKLLEEFESGGDIREACRCIKELGMPFFHHEVVKKSLVALMENKNERPWMLLKECCNIGLITLNQVTKGFTRVNESLDDLSLDVPDASKQFDSYVKRARAEGWLEGSLGAD